MLGNINDRLGRSRRRAILGPWLQIKCLPDLWILDLFIPAYFARVQTFVSFRSYVHSNIVLSLIKLHFPVTFAFADIADLRAEVYISL